MLTKLLCLLTQMFFLCCSVAISPSLLFRVKFMLYCLIDGKIGCTVCDRLDSYIGAVFSHSVLSDFLRPYGLQSPLSMGLSRQEYQSGLPFPPPGDLPHPGIEPMSLRSPVLAGGFFYLLVPPGKPNTSNPRSFRLIHIFTVLCFKNVSVTQNLDVICTDSQGCLILQFLELFSVTLKIFSSVLSLSHV